MKLHSFMYDYGARWYISAIGGNMTSIIPGLGEVSNPYASTYTYTADGDILNLHRRGFIEEVNGNKNYGMIDDLTFDVKVNGHINTVTDNASGPGQAKGFFPTSASFIYDDKSGNILDDGSRTYTYNTIDLPSRIENSESGKNEDIIYSYQGEKYQIVGDSTLRYIGIFELEDLEVKKIHYTDGFIYKDDSLRLRYRLKDHLGNPVVIFEDVNKDGRIDIDSTGLDAPEVIERMVYYPFGLSFDGLYDASGSHDLGSRYKFGGKEVVSGVYDFGARYYYPAIGRFMGVDPLAEDYAGVSPYAYVLNNPLQFIDPTGMSVETTIVGKNDNGTYNVKGWIDDGKTDVVTTDGVKIGNSLTTHSFVDDQGNAVKGAVIDRSDNSGQNFFNDEIKGIGLSEYMGNAQGGEPLDFKHKGMNSRNDGTSVGQHHYRGMPFEGKIASARDIGNYSAGYVAGNYGQGWKASRKAFDALETKQKYGTWNVFKWRSWETEGQPTQLAQRAGHNVGYPIFKQRQFERQWQKATTPYQVGPKY